MDKMLDYLRRQEQDPSQPFFIYYAPHAIHQ